MNHQHYKSLFDIPDGVYYTNTPGSGLLPKSSKIWRMERDQAFFESSGDLREKQVAFNMAVKKSIATFFTCAIHNVYNTFSFSTGFNALMAKFPKDTNILLLENDYPSINVAIAQAGFQHHFVPVDENLEAHILAAVEKHQPQLLILSIVQYISGIKIDLGFIKKLKEQFPALLIIGDGTQFLGTAVFDFSQSGFDIVGASGYKWLMGGYGNGFLLLSDYAKTFLFPNNKLDQMPPFGIEKDPIQLYFEPGQIDTLSQGTLQKGLELLCDLGLENTTSYTHQLVEKVKDELGNRGLLSKMVLKRKEISTIFNIQIDQKHVELLLNNGIKCFPRGNGIRVGFHFYNDQSDLDQLLDIIDTKILK